MESFLRAHAIRKRNTAVQSKTSKKLKSRLKLMLNGYERNDTNAIRNAVEDNSDDSEVELVLDDTSDFDLCTNDRSRISTSSTEIPPSSCPQVQTHNGIDHESDDEEGSQSGETALKNTDLDECSVMAVKDESIAQISDEDLSINASDKTVSSYDSEQGSDVSLYEVTDEDSKQDLFDKESSFLTNEQSEDEPSVSSDADGNILSGLADVDVSPQASSDDAQQSLTRSACSSDLVLSVDQSNTSSSTCSDFDKDGQLAAVISDKLNTLKQHCKELNRSKINSNIPSSSGYIQINKKRKKSVPQNPHSEKESKIKKQDIVSEESYTLDASEHHLPEFPVLFRDHNFSTTKNITPKFINTKTNDETFKIKKLNDVKINQFSSDSINYKESRSIGPDLIYGNDPAAINSVIENGIESTSEKNIDVSDEIPCNYQFYQVKKGFVAVIQHPANIYFYGKAKVTSLCGSVEIMGYLLQQNATEIYAPRFSFAQKLKTIANESDHYGLFSKLTALGMSVLQTEDIVVSIREFDAVLFFERLDDAGLDFVEREFNTLEMFKSSRRTLINAELPEVASKLSCSFYSHRPNKTFEEIPIWPQIIEQSKGDMSKGIICGGKGTGKSTFLKYYINSLVSQTPVLVIDLDPGQAEFTVAGSVSVLLVRKPVIGPNFTHIQQPTRMLNVGLINILDNVERYISAVRELLEYVSQAQEFKNMPWIVNTMGMSNTLGLKILTCILLLLKPTFLVQMDSKIKAKCFEVELNAEEIKRLYLEDYETDKMFENIQCPRELNYKYFLSTQPQESRGDHMMARDKRLLCFLSYFGKVLDRENGNLLSVRPYVIQLNSIKIATTCEVDEKAVTSVINGKIVALCEDASHRNNRKTFTLDDAALVCHGHGLVRGVNVDTSSVYVLSGERSEVLSRVNVLLYCDSDPELTLCEASIPSGTIIPYRAPLKPHNKQLLSTPKRRFNLLQLLKVKKNS